MVDTDRDLFNVSIVKFCLACPCDTVLDLSCCSVYVKTSLFFQVSISLGTYFLTYLMDVKTIIGIDVMTMTMN